MPYKLRCSYYDLYIGLDENTFHASVGAALRFCHGSGADFTIVDIIDTTGDSQNLIHIDDLSSDKLNNSIIGRIVLNDDSTNDSWSSVLLQLSWANHGGFYAVLLDVSLLPLVAACSLISDFMTAHPPESSVTRVWIRCKPSDWEKWNRIRVVTGHPSKLAVVLDLSGGLIGFSEQWFSEPVAAVLLSEQSVPESILLRFARQNTQPILSNPSMIPAVISMFKNFPPLGPHESQIAPYHDTLQLPLQPLRDEMENVVYETFESDSKKYDLYRDAILRSITKFQGQCHIAVVGAGRGGLVDAAISAIKIQGGNDMSKFTITCVEKNRFAAITLMHRLKKQWDIPNGPIISINHTDMRDWIPESKVDILVSELLGSLGDNEASPECLNDSVMSHLCPNGGISIPYRYFSTIEPVSAHKAWTQVRDMNKFQTPLVTLFHSFCQPSHEGTQPLFDFMHDCESRPCPFERSRTLTWTSKSDTLIHGFAGYFHCDLDAEGTVVMSTDPRTATPTMVSWFPAFLPLQIPVYVRSGDNIELYVRRRSTNLKMWIEWTLLEPIVQPTNNVDGSHHSVGLI